MFQHELKNAYIGEYKGRLPIGYQEVEWIWMSWDYSSWSHINTKLFPYNNYQVETKIETLSAESERCIFWWFVNGSSSTTYTYNYYNLINYLNQFYRWINNYAWNWWSFPSTVGVQYEIIYNNSSNRVIVNWSDIWDCTWTVWFPWSELCINVRWKSGQYYWWKYKYFYFKVYDKTAWQYVRDLVPCYRKSDNVIWMYDLVNNQFYTNAWSWTFTKWPDVS